MPDCLITVFYWVKCALFSKNVLLRYCLRAHYTSKVPEKRFKINWKCAKNHCKINVYTILVCALYSDVRYTRMCTILVCALYLYVYHCGKE
jgi:hypothetical protein